VSATATASILSPPPGAEHPPEYDRGWLVDAGKRSPFLSYSDEGAAVNWSAELEELHEESTRSHPIDRWTRSAIIARLGALDAQATVADIGCSTGHLLEDLSATYPGRLLVGVDLVVAGLLKAHELVPGALLLHADACALPLLEASVDAIVSSNLLEHVPDDVGALAEFRRILRPGGRAVMVVPAGPRTYDYYDRFLGHERRYARRELATKAREAGLEVLEDAFLASLVYPAFWLAKQRNRLLHRELDGVALERQVAADIARTDTPGLVWLWRLEERLGMRLPFGIRSLVVARKPA
jgi:SAM-dependent methyltransferase